MIKRFEDIVARQKSRELDELIDIASETSRLIYHLIESLKISKFKGIKFK